MKKFSLTKNQRRFLMLWIAFHLIALTVNIVPIKGEHVSSNHRLYYILTEADNPDEFWPFVRYVVPGAIYTKYGGMTTQTYATGQTDNFNGIFNDYDISEFLVYVLGAIAIIYIPKLW